MRAGPAVGLGCCLLLVLLLLAQPGVGQETKHSRVGDSRYWTPECFSECYQVYLQCIGRIFPPMAYNNEQMVVLFRNKNLTYHELIEDCSAKYHKTIHIEEDAKREVEMKNLNATVGLKSNFDLCVFSQCGAGGYYGSFNINQMHYKGITLLVNKPLDPAYQFYFDMNSV